jgi:hypothetical protein
VVKLSWWTIHGFCSGGQLLTTTRTYNFPIQLCIGPLIGAISAGCTAVLKPSESAPHCAAIMQKIVEESLDVSAYAVVQGAIPETSLLLDQKWDKYVTFTPAYHPTTDFSKNLLHGRLFRRQNHLAKSRLITHPRNPRARRPQSCNHHQNRRHAPRRPSPPLGQAHEQWPNLRLTQLHTNRRIHAANIYCRVQSRVRRVLSTRCEGVA